MNAYKMQHYIELLKLEKHIEGGYFSVCYKSEDKVIPLNERYGTDNSHRHAGTSIYFLLEKEDFSAWHRLKSDEIWHYYDGGSAIHLHVIHPNGKFEILTLGHPLNLSDAAFQIVIKAGCWFAAELQDKTSFALVGCTVSPGFEYDDFELAQNNELIQLYPHLLENIKKFIR